MQQLEVRGYVKSINDFVYNPIVDFSKRKFDTGLGETHGRATSIVYADIKFLDLCINEKDKNDKKIFANDLVMYKGKLYQVVFYYGAFLLKDVFSKCTEYLKNEYTYFNNAEIVGNIHQNKDLTEQG